MGRVTQMSQCSVSSYLHQGLGATTETQDVLKETSSEANTTGTTFKVYTFKNVLRTSPDLHPFALSFNYSQPKTKSNMFFLFADQQQTLFNFAKIQQTHCCCLSSHFQMTTETEIPVTAASLVSRELKEIQHKEPWTTSLLFLELNTYCTRGHLNLQTEWNWCLILCEETWGCATKNGCHFISWTFLLNSVAARMWSVFVHQLSAWILLRWPWLYTTELSSFTYLLQVKRLKRRKWDKKCSPLTYIRFLVHILFCVYYFIIYLVYTIN